VNRQTEFARMGVHSANADVTLTTDKATLEALAAGTISLKEAGDKVRIDGDPSQLESWMGLHVAFNLWFDVVSP
jgi:alkyl sulfatase BDS1-like metallo-beta-lactamase superfamily hydrolase